MLKSEIYGELRNEIGTNRCHKVRNRAHIPGIVYGHNMVSKPVEVDKREMDRIVRDYGTNILVDLHIGNDEATAMIKEMQLDPVTNEIIHIDFQEISYNELINTTVPIKLKGKEKVESGIGVVQQQLRELHISCLPQHIPESIEVDVSLLRMGSPLKVADMEIGEELSILNDPYEIVAALAKAEKVIENVQEENDLIENIMNVSDERNKKK